MACDGGGAGSCCCCSSHRSAGDVSLQRSIIFHYRCRKMHPAEEVFKLGFALPTCEEKLAKKVAKLTDP